MLKVKACLGTEWVGDELIYDRKEHIAHYDKGMFFQEIMRPGPNERPQPPFREEENLRLLEAFDKEYVEDDWYSVLEYDPLVDRKERIPIWEMGEYVLYALCLMRYSRRGEYLGYKRCSDKIWQVLNRMPFDILIAVPGSEFDEASFGEDHAVLQCLLLEQARESEK